MSLTERSAKDECLACVYQRLSYTSIVRGKISFYDVTFTADRGLAEELIRDAQCFVERIVQYLSQAGMR